MIENLKPLGAFVENTIRPLLKESQELACTLVRTDLVPARDIPKILRGFFVLSVLNAVLDFLKAIISVAIIGFVSWKIFQ